MSIIMTTRYVLRFPDGTVQELEAPLSAGVGDLLPSPEGLAVTPEPSDKLFIRKVEEIQTGEWPRLRIYYLEAF